MIDQPEVAGGTVKADYTVGSTYEFTKFLYTANLNYFFALYNDVTSLLVRNLSSNVDNFAAAFSSPTIKSLS